MYANRIRKMINIELGNEIKKHVFPSFITVIRARLSIIYCLGGRRIFGKGGGGGSHGFKLEQRGISRRQKSKNCLMGDQENCIVTQPISADPSGDK